MPYIPKCFQGLGFAKYKLHDPPFLLVVLGLVSALSALLRSRRLNHGSRQFLQNLTLKTLDLEIDYQGLSFDIVQFGLVYSMGRRLSRNPRRPYEKVRLDAECETCCESMGSVLRRSYVGFYMP
ncbi:hypothetical protein NC653_018159 [Populus alba x Populus x berolinensis]|uniref:Uncharacterized protein n=1 Tax=Populus alba x Populus x berolinensis TaxID=444605 RepID=A0AAD6VUM4_9ROSI|nr:hypothetical protein NC653_018159 [Populus alba x Populus x berolinensis]